MDRLSEPPCTCADSGLRYNLQNLKPDWNALKELLAVVHLITIEVWTRSSFGRGGGDRTIKPSSLLQTRKLLIPSFDKSDRNARNAQTRYKKRTSVKRGCWRQCPAPALYDY